MVSVAQFTAIVHPAMVAPQLAVASAVAVNELLPVVNVPNNEKLLPVFPSVLAAVDAPELVTITFCVVLFNPVI